MLVKLIHGVLPLVGIDDEGNCIMDIWGKMPPPQPIDISLKFFVSHKFVFRVVAR